MTESFTKANIKDVEIIMKKSLTRKNVNFNDFITNFCMDLLKSNNIYNTLIANKILQFQRTITDSRMLLQLEDNFLELKKCLYAFKSERKNMNFSISGRQKSFLDFMKKVVLFAYKKKPVSKINDILGFRIICGYNQNEDTIESIQLCYEIIETIINFFVVEKNYMPVDAEPIFESKFDTKKYPSIIVPKFEDTAKWISAIYRNNIKDYIVNPKGNGYQSLHCVLISPEGSKIEIQVRTFAMHKHAELGKAIHSGHKNDRYSEVGFLNDFDLTRVNIPGFIATNDGNVLKILDLIGLITSINPFSKI